VGRRLVAAGLSRPLEESLSSHDSIRSPARQRRRGGSRDEPAAAIAAADRAQVSPLTVNRLSVYLRSLRQLEARGVERVSSQQLAGEFHLSSTQIRKDLAQFGEFGVRGVGYDVPTLVQRLTSLLRLERAHRMVIIGMGNMGLALARYPAFNTESFKVVAGFDADPGKVGRRVGSFQIHPMTDLRSVVAETGAEMAILTVPAEAAAEAYQSLQACGIRSILNFAPVTLPPSPRCRIKNVDLRIPLEELAFFELGRDS